ncbi:MAG: hypothetical protein RSC73_04585 [Ruthenibacterium sp.]
MLNFVLQDEKSMDALLFAAKLSGNSAFVLQMQRIANTMAALL